MFFNDVCSYMYNTKSTYVTHSTYLHSVTIHPTRYPSCVLLSLLQFFHFVRVAVIEVKVRFSFWSVSSSIRAFSNVAFFQFFITQISYNLLFSIAFIYYYISFESIFKFVCGSDLCKSAKNHDLKIYTNVVLYGK